MLSTPARTTGTTFASIIARWRLSERRPYPHTARSEVPTSATAWMRSGFDSRLEIWPGDDLDGERRAEPEGQRDPEPENQ